MTQHKERVLACMMQFAKSDVEKQLFEEYGIKEGQMHYRDSIEGNCAICNRAIWIGPRQQALLAKENLRTICLNCAALQSVVAGEQMTIDNLGNTDTVE